MKRKARLAGFLLIVPLLIIGCDDDDNNRGSSRGDTQTPGSPLVPGTPGNPGTPTNPGTGTPTNPDTGTPTNPDTGMPGTPTDPGLGNPGLGTPGMPGTGTPGTPGVARDGPANPGTPPSQRTGSVASGREVFRFETFGNERFWTDAIRLPQGIVAAGVTPMQALALGVQVDVEALDQATRDAVASQLAADPTGASSALLNDPATTVALVNANAVIGLPAKDSNGDGRIDVAAGDKAGASCALCHTITDGSVLRHPSGGSIGRRIDGLATHSLDFGSVLAVAQNSRAYYPALQLSLAANGGATLGRAATGLTENSTEAEVDAYLRDKNAYPIGMFDDTVDGNGDPMHNMPLFEQDLASPYGSEGTFTVQDDFANFVYSVLFDPTTLTLPSGRAFLVKLGGAGAGNEIVDDYIQVLAETGVSAYPFVEISETAPDQVGSLRFPAGIRVEQQLLSDLNAYLFQLPAPQGTVTDSASVARGREVFRSAGCTGCHNVDQSRPVPTFIVPMPTIFPGDSPVVLLARRDPPLNPILDTPGVFFDDKMAVVNASIRGDVRGTALPLLLDLARKPVFLHDNSVPDLETLLNPVRGGTVPHPFAIADAGERAAVIAFLRSLDTDGRDDDGRDRGGGPGTTPPGATNPGTGNPGTTPPGATAPGTTGPGTTQPPVATNPGTSNPVTTAPGTMAPGATAPGTTPPVATNPGTSNPGTTNPGTTAPGTTSPGTTAPGAINPGTTSPGTTSPGTTSPGTTSPGLQQPSLGNDLLTVLISVPGAIGGLLGADSD